ncbi:MAG: TRAP transporter substrate-binding protein [Alphaproteobacteria bacterium]|nr:TRAP transporter substrate-binding protein [Alphaproteobacteria bacterium]
MIRAMLAALFAAALALGCGSAHAQKQLKVNESLGPGSAEATALDAFKKAVESGSNGALTVAIHLQDALGNPQTSMENLMTGSLELYSGALEYYQPLAPEELGVISVPYLLVDQDHLRRYLKSPVFAAAQQKLLDRGIRFLSTDFDAVRGPYRVIVSSKPILKVEDLEGLKMRMVPNEVSIRAWTNLGAAPSQIAWTQTYLAIRQGVVQAVTAPLSVVRSMKFTEVAPYITAIKEYPQTWPITISERVWKGLTADQQKLLVEAANMAGKVYTDATMEHARDDIALMIRENNAVFIEVNTEPFRKKMEPFYQQLIRDGLMTQKVYDAVTALIAKPQ